MSQDRQEGHRWFAAFYDFVTAHEDRHLRRMRQKVVGGAKGRVLEIGCGTGATFPYYSEGLEHVVATEPDPYMLRRARKNAARLAKTLDIQQAPAESLPFEDASFDTVVSFFVMCTVADPLRALSEVRRVLRPGGELRFYEHVRYGHPFGAFWQDLVTPVWRWFGAGCHPNRDVESFIRSAGFTVTEIEGLKPYPPLPPAAFIRPHIKGIATP